MKRFLVIAMRKPTFDTAMVGPHHAFLDGLRASGQLELNGGFADRSGGAYLLTVDNATQAQAIIEQDPLYTSASSDFSIHEWNAQ